MVKARPSCRRATVLVVLGVCIAGLAHLQAFSIPELVRRCAEEANKTPREFLDGIRASARLWRRGEEIAGRRDFMNLLETEVMTEPGLNMVIGGKSLGKTKIIQNMTAVIGANRPLLYVDMRLPPKPLSTNVLECLQEAAKQKQLPPGFRVFNGIRFKVLWFNIELAVPSPQVFLEAFINKGRAISRVPIIIVDEANVAFPNGNGQGANDGKKGAAKAAVDAFVAITKQSEQACIILVASEYTFPYRLETLGLNAYDSLGVILVPEVGEEAFIEVLTQKWGMPQNLATAFFETFGGDIFLCSQALSKLVERFTMGDEDRFDPYRLRDNFGLDGLVMNTSTRPHMENLGRQGWSPIDGNSMENQTSAKKIAKMNFGAVIGSRSTLFGPLRSLEGEMFKDRNNKQVLIPTTQYTRKCIQIEIEAVRKKEEEEAARKKEEEEAARWKPPWKW